jgi:hypothetical protein
MQTRKLLTLLIVGLGLTAAVPQTQADSYCVPIDKNTKRGALAADFCLDTSSDQIQISGAATLSDGTPIGVSADGTLIVVPGHGQGSEWTLDADVVISDLSSGAAVARKTLSISGNSFGSIVQKLITKLTNLVF